MCVGPAEKFDKETEQPVAHQVQARHLVPEQRDAPQVVQECEQNNAFEAHLVQLARVVQNRILDRTVVREREVHADRARGRFAKEFAVDEIAPAPPGIGKRCGQEAQVERFPQVHLVALDADDRENRSEDHAAVVAHAGDSRKVVTQRVVGEREDDFGRVREVIARLVEEYVTEARPDEDARDGPGEQAVEIFLGVAELFFLVDLPHGDVGREEGENIHDAVPTDREVPEFNGRSVKIGRYKVPPRKIHASFLCSSSGVPNNL